MEAQVESTTSSSAKPQSIVEQLLEIAKKYDAMDMIGGSTSWRWQEGLITRMPKTRTVAAILTKAFNSDDPNVWLTKVRVGALSTFIQNSFKDSLSAQIRWDYVIEDLYDSIFIVLSMGKSGISKGDLIYNFCYFRYTMSSETRDYFDEPDVKQLISLFGKWAEAKLERVLSKIKIYSIIGDHYYMDSMFISCELHSQNILELSKLKNKMIGFNSVHDMWRNTYMDLSDEEHIYFEKRMLEFYDKMQKEIKNRREFSRYKDSSKVRVFSLSSYTMPSQGKEGLQ